MCGVRAWLVVCLALVSCAWSSPAAPPECALPDRCARRATHSSAINEYPFTVDGLEVLIEYTDGSYFKVQCPENLTLDNPALPQFKSELRVGKVYLSNCGEPRRPYSDVLRAFNVSVSVLELLKLSGGGTLRAEQLRGLHHLPRLSLLNMAAASGALTNLSLAVLHLNNVSLPPGELHALPRSLTELHLMAVGEAPDAASLRRLASLRKLYVWVNGSVNMSAGGAPQLQTLTVAAERVRLAPELPGTLVALTAWGLEGAGAAGARRLEPWRGCAALVSLQVRFAQAEAVAAGWVRRCRALRTLRLELSPLLRTLEPGALAGAANLTNLTVSGCALTSLPLGLFDDAKNLQNVDLSRNRLHDLPSGVFVHSASLRSLNLERNQLTGDVLASLEYVESLSHLSLSHNPDLHPDCGSPENNYGKLSKLKSLLNLTELSLRNTSTDVICRDWRNLPHLKKLDLSMTHIKYITYADVQFNTKSRVLVDLSEGQLTNVHLLREQLDDKYDSHSMADIQLGSGVRCDCELYWAAAALQRRPPRVALSGQCAGSGRQLGAVPLDALECHAPCGRCTCSERPLGDAALVRVQCAGAGLRAAQAAWAGVRVRAAWAVAPPAAVWWALNLTHNNITRLDLADLPHNLTELDVRHNLVSEISEAAARRLANVSVWLTHNALRCGCEQAAALSALQAGPALRDRPACRGGAALPREPCAAVPLALALGVPLALLALLALGGALLLPALRRRAKRVAAAVQWQWDVFVSFSHKDEEVARRLVAGLEQRGYRVCVHDRDWAAGGWIPAQIAASVRGSRLTLCLVSEHFLRSSWARAEVREALGAAARGAGEARLLVVLLAPPARLPLDASLRHYLATNTYVEWGDQYFWRKLLKALPQSPAHTDAPDAACTTVASAATNVTETIPKPDAAVTPVAASSTDVSLPVAEPSGASLSEESSSSSASSTSAECSSSISLEHSPAPVPHWHTTAVTPRALCVQV